MSMPIFDTKIGKTKNKSETSWKTEDKAVLTGIGSSINHALSQYSRVHFKRRFGNLDILHAPEAFMLPLSVSHDVLGCKPGQTKARIACTICSCEESEAPVDVPSYVALCAFHQNKSYPDRLLPKIYLSPASNNQTECHRQLQFAHPTSSLEVFGMSVSNLALSRTLQDEIGDSIKDFYLSLLAESYTTKDIQETLSMAITLAPKPHNDGIQNKTLLQLRTANATDLEANEARRIIIEG